MLQPREKTNNKGWWKDTKVSHFVFSGLWNKCTDKALSQLVEKQRKTKKENKTITSKLNRKAYRDRY